MAAALDEAGFGEDFEVVGHGGLGEAEFVGEFDHVVHLFADWFARQYLHHVETRRFTERGEDFGEFVLGSGGFRFCGPARGDWLRDVFSNAVGISGRSRQAADGWL